MTSTYKTALGATLLLALIAGGTAVSAQERGHGFDFAAVDTNGDGEVTKVEVDQFRAAQFAKIDTDGNGSVDAAELQAAHEMRQQERRTDRSERMIERADANDDGVLTPDEMQPQRRGGDMFERLDADDNGSISQAEMDAAKERMEDRRDGRRGHDRPSRG